MAVPLSLGPVHHLRLTVTDVQRSRAFYTELLGFQIAMDAPPPADDPHHDLTTDLLQGGIVMVNGDLLLGLRPVDAERAGDRFDPFRCGLDHLSFSVAAKPGSTVSVSAWLVLAELTRGGWRAGRIERAGLALEGRRRGSPTRLAWWWRVPAG
jgi:catechol 2,3-dioxygenase-like lactoylglutathione lyase family enzyme